MSLETSWSIPTDLEASITSLREENFLCPLTGVGGRADSSDLILRSSSEISLFPPTSDSGLRTEAASLDRGSMWRTPMS